MTTKFDPHLDAKTPFDLHSSVQASELLCKKFKKNLSSLEQIRVESFYGESCFLLKGLVGNSNKAHVFEFFAEISPALGREDAFDFLLDFFDGILEIFFNNERDARLPLDFSLRHFENTRLWARQEFRNFEAEWLADSMLKSPDNKKRSKIE